MNPLTRSLYRELAPMLAEPADRHAHEFLLSACNRATRRLLTGDMRRRDCQVFSRKGAPCQREALPGSGFCPSHKHLVEEEHDLEPTAAGLSFESFEKSSWSGRSRGAPLGDIALRTKE